MAQKNNKAKLSESDVVKIRDSKLSSESLARELNVSKSTIKRIKNRTQWRHVE